MLSLELSKTTVGYDKKPTVIDVNLISKPGKIVALVGPNGCGKSTILKTSCGLLEKQAGVVLLDNKEIELVSGRDRSSKLSVLLTNNKAENYVTCRDVVAVGRYNFTGIQGRLSAEDNQRIEEALELVKASDLIDSLFSSLSDGQKQRIFLARALVQEPKIMILDEPTSFLDVGYKLEFLEILRDLVRSKNISAILSLHEVELVYHFADEVICIKDNKVIKTGETKEVLSKEFISELFNIKSEYFGRIYNF